MLVRDSPLNFKPIRVKYLIEKIIDTTVVLSIIPPWTNPIHIQMKDRLGFMLSVITLRSYGLY